MTDEQPESTYGMVMPFIACVGNGGTYDDRAFVAGYECGTIDAALRSLKEVGGMIERWVNPSLVPQLDLIAMRYQQRLVSIESSEDGHYVRVQIGHPLLVGEPTVDDD